MYKKTDTWSVTPFPAWLTNRLFLMFPAIPCQDMSLMIYPLILAHRNLTIFHINEMLFADRLTIDAVLMTMALKIVIICEHFQWQPRQHKHCYCDEIDGDSNSITIFRFCSSRYVSYLTDQIEISFLISSSQVVIMLLFLYHICSRWYRPIMCLL